MGGGCNLWDRNKLDSQAYKQAYKQGPVHINTQDHIHKTTLWFMQTESVSSRDLSSTEGLRGNQTEYLRQAFLIPLVRWKSHTHACRHMCVRAPTHTHACTIFRQRKQDITKFVCLLTSVFVFLRVHCYPYFSVPLQNFQNTFAFQNAGAGWGSNILQCHCSHLSNYSFFIACLMCWPYHPFFL